jgi:ribosomal protein S1
VVLNIDSEYECFSLGIKQLDGRSLEGRGRTFLPLCGDIVEGAAINITDVRRFSFDPGTASRDLITFPNCRLKNRRPGKVFQDTRQG